MKNNAITLRSPDLWVEFVALSEHVARVTAGTAFIPGDLVRGQDGRDWGDLAPEDLEIVYDVVNDVFLFPESNEEIVTGVVENDAA